MSSVSLDFHGGFLEQIAASDPGAEHVVNLGPGGTSSPSWGGAALRRIHLLPLPHYSPGLNSVEGLWDQPRGALGNDRFETLEALEPAVTEALRPFWEGRHSVPVLLCCIA